MAVTGRGLDEGRELIRQKKVILQSKAGVEVIRFFEEDRSDAIKRVGRRPAFRDLIKALFAGGGECVFVESIDRLAATPEAQEAVSVFLERAGFEVICCHNTARDATRDAIKKSIDAFAECQKDLLNARLSGLRKNKKNAKRVGAKPYGHYPGERDVITRMRSLEQSGLSCNAIAKMFVDENVPSRRGGVWYATTVSKILNRTGSTSCESQRP